MRASLVLVAATIAVAAPRLTAQTAPGAATPAATALAVPPAAQQIAAAVLPLPETMRAGARVWGYGPDGSFIELRAGTGSMTCIADDPRDTRRFHVACYHNSMEPFMARGRELRAQGASQAVVDSVRRADALAGRIRMPSSASLFSLTGPGDSYDPATNTTHGVSKLYVIYLPFATAESTGLPTRPIPGQPTPWLMHPGDVGAHIMFVPTM